MRAARPVAGYVLLFLVFVVRHLPAQTSEESSTPLRPAFDGESWGFIDRNGRFAIKPQFERAGPFQAGLAPVRIGEKYGFIDATGKTVIPPTFELADSHYEGLASVKKFGKVGYIDTKGEPVIPDIFEWGGPFHNGLAAVKSYGKFGYIDTLGELVIRREWDRAGEFSEGFAAVSRDGKHFGFINRLGAVAIPDNFDGVGPFSEGLASAKQGGKTGFINRRGVFPPTMEPRYTDAGPFEFGLAPVCLDTRWGAIDTKGALVVPARFDSLVPTGPGQVAVFQDRHLAFGRQFASGQFVFQAAAAQGWDKVQCKSTPQGAMVYKPDVYDFDHSSDPVNYTDLKSNHRNRAPGKTDKITIHLRHFGEYRLIFELNGVNKVLHWSWTTGNVVTANFP